MKLVHASDWHNAQFKLPPADLYVFTGDMLPNFLVYTYEVKGLGQVDWVSNASLVCDPAPRPQGPLRARKVVPEVEADYQARYLELRGPGNLRSCLGTADAPVVVCRGNHDFSPLAPWFGGEVYEVSEDPSVAFEVAGLRVGGFRGIPYIGGSWADELQPREMAHRVDGLPPELDVVVTHAPPRQALDEVPDHIWGPRSCGAPALEAYHAGRHQARVPARAHLFGHIHEQGGKTMRRKGTLFSNAATTWKALEL